MPHHIFYSWQSDTDSRIGRGFIQWALDRAIRAVNADADVDPADRDLRADRDTANVPGMPPLADTIFGKIDRAVAFLSDLTHVATRANGERSPNPNVLLEHGWALKSRGWGSIIGVMNTAMGHPGEHPLPFDLRHFRRPIFYHCPADASDDERRASRLELQKSLEAALRAILDDDVLRSARVPAPPTEPHPHDVALLQRYRAQFPEDLRDFWRTHHFGRVFKREVLLPLYEVNVRWQGAEFEFEDSVLQDAAVKLREALRDLVSPTFLYLKNIEEKSSAISVDPSKRPPDGVRDVVSMFNALARNFVDEIDAFERTGRSRIRVAAAPAAIPVIDVRWEAAAGMATDLAADRMRGGSPEIISMPSVTLRVVPLAAMDRPMLDPKRVQAAAVHFPPDFGARVHSDTDERQWWSYGLPLRQTANNPETRWLTRLVRPGAIEYEATIGDRIGNDPEIVVDGRELEATIVTQLGRLTRIAWALDLGGPGLVTISFRGIEDVQLARARPGGRKIRKPELFLPELRAEDLGAPIQPQLRDQFNVLWQASGWADGSPSFN